MVALVAGDSPGLNLTSLATLGVAGNAALGRGTARLTVNVANGNLMLQNQDDILAGPGRWSVSQRTYNGQDLLAGDHRLPGRPPDPHRRPRHRQAHHLPARRPRQPPGRTHVTKWRAAAGRLFLSFRLARASLPGLMRTGLRQRDLAGQGCQEGSLMCKRHDAVGQRYVAGLNLP